MSLAIVGWLLVQSEWDRAAKLSAFISRNEEIERLQSGKTKLYVPDEQNRKIPLHPMILAVFKRVQEERSAKKD